MTQGESAAARAQVSSPQFLGRKVSKVARKRVCKRTPFATWNSVVKNRILGVNSEIAEQISFYKGGLHTLLNLICT